MIDWKEQAAQTRKDREKFRRAFPLWPVGGKKKALEHFNRLSRQQQRDVERLLELEGGKKKYESDISTIAGRFHRDRSVRLPRINKRATISPAALRAAVRQGQQSQPPLF